MASVLRALPRTVRPRTARPLLPELVDRPLPTAGVGRVAARLLRWGVAGARMVAGLTADRLKGEVDDHVFGRRLRALFEDVGGTGVKLGQQLSVRADLFPFGVCEELSLLMDRVAPFPVDYALERLRATTGRAVEADFEHIDPKPIGSASVACVFAGRLRGGQRVAIKVQRPDVGASFAADLQAFAWASRLLELTTLVREGMFEGLRVELRAMFLEELDFVAEARYQRIFRKYVRRDGLKRLFDAPRVFDALCGPDVLVTAFVEGVPMTTILEAVERRDEAALQAIRAQGVDPAVLGKTLWEVSSWGKFEAPFYHADPHPGNLIAQADSRLIFLDFGACGITSGRTWHTYKEMMNRLERDDFAAVADVSLAITMPLPRLDVPALRTHFEETFFFFLLGLRDPAARWWERTTAGVWLGFLEVARAQGIPVNLDTVRLARSTLLYDTLAARVNPDLDLDVWVRYLRRSEVRRARRYERWLDRALGRRGLEAAAANAAVEARRVRAAVDRVVSIPRASTSALVRRAPAAAAAMLRLTCQSVAVVLVATLVKGMPGVPELRHAAEASRDPVVVTLVLLLTLLSWRRLSWRLGEVG